MAATSDDPRTVVYTPPGWLRGAAAGYLTIQGLGGLAWWILLFTWPASRPFFLATGAPDATLLALAAPDLALYVGGSLLAASGLWLRARWAWPVLCVHAGAAAYAALYCLNLWWLDSNAWLGAVVMLPSLFVPLLFVWQLRPRQTSAC